MTTRKMNPLGVIEQPKNSGCFPPLDKEKKRFWGNGGGWLKCLVDQQGWRIQLDGADAVGGYEISVGSHQHFQFFPENTPVDFTVTDRGTIRINQVGMVAGWSPLIITRVY